MEKTGKQRHLYFMRVSENCQLLTELYVVPDEFNSHESWFEDRHLQEIIVLLRDPIKARVVSYYEQTRRKKWSGIKEGTDSKKKPVPDEHQITTGQSVKIGYKFVDSNLHHHSCLMPTKFGSPVWKEDNSKHAGGGFSYARLFAKKLVVFVCKYHKATVGQTTSQLMRSLCATPPSKHIAISSYFAPKMDDDFVGPSVTNSAHRKRNRLRKIVKGKNAASTIGTKENGSTSGTQKGGGFLEKELRNSDTETAHEIKKEPSPSPSVSDMDCNSDGMPDNTEQNKRLVSHLSSYNCKDGVSLPCDDFSRSSHPVASQEEIPLKTTITSLVKSEDDRDMDGRGHLRFSGVSNISKPVKMEDVSVDLHKEADVWSSEGAPSLQSLRSNLNGSILATKSEVIFRSSSVKKEVEELTCDSQGSNLNGSFPATKSEAIFGPSTIQKEVERLTCDSEVTEGSPSSGDFDQRPKKRMNPRVKSKLSLKRNEAKKACAAKLRSSMDKGLHEDGVKEESMNCASTDQKYLDTDVSKKKKLQLGDVSVKDNGLTNNKNCSEIISHPTSNCSVVLTDIKMTNHDTCWDASASTNMSLLKRPIKDLQEIPSENRKSCSTSSEDDLMSASFLYQEKRPKDSVDGVRRSTLQTTGNGENKLNGIGEKDSASSEGELGDSRHSPTKASKWLNKNQMIKKSKQSRLALSDRQKKSGKDLVQNVTKESSHAEKKSGHRKKIQKLLTDLAWDSDSQEMSQNKRPSKVILSHGDKPQKSSSDEPMDVEDASPKTTPAEELGHVYSDEVEALSSDQYKLDDDQDAKAASRPELMQDYLVHISDDSSSEDAQENKRPEEEGTTALEGTSQEGILGDPEDEVIDLSQGVDDDDDSDSWFDNIFGTIRLVSELKAEDIEYLTQRNKKYLHNIFQGKRKCERHQCYKKKGPQRIAMAGNVRLGPFREEQMDTVMGELVKVYCTKHFKYMDYLSKVLLPEAMTKIYMDVHRASHAQAEEVIKGLQKEQPRKT